MCGGVVRARADELWMSNEQREASENHFVLIHVEKAISYWCRLVRVLALSLPVA